MSWSPFEAGMLVCFGASWPFAVYKTWRTKTSKGKSFAFMGLIFTGYVSGTIYRAWENPNPIVYLYLFNGALVLADIVLSYRYRNSDGVAPVVPPPAESP